MKTRYDNVTVSPDRHGKLRARFRKAGHKPVYMKTLPDQPGFEAEHKALLANRSAIEVRHTPRSIHDLCTRYYRSANFMRGGEEDRSKRRGILESFRADFGNDMVADFQPEHIEAILLGRLEKRRNDKGRVVGGQVAASNLRKQLRRMFTYARVKLKWIDHNPVEDAETVGKKRIAGFHTWTEDEIALFKQRHPIGSKARLAMEIILWTGQRRGDARLFGPKHIVRGKINFQAAKNGADLWLPVAPDLRRAIDAMPSVGISTYLVTDYGKTFTKAGFGNKMREWCDDAGLPQCSAHGLRKAIARRMAESEASHLGIKAVGGWKGDAEVSLYTEAANRERMADIALGRAIGRFSDGGDQKDV